jgi:hypothetical protein
LPSESVPFKTVQIIAAALIFGPLLFAAIAITSVWGQPPNDPTIAYVAAFVFASMLVASVIIPPIVVGQNLAKLGGQATEISTLDLFNVYQTRTIVRAALLEGGAFFCIIAYMVTHLWWALAMAFGLLAAMVVFFPMRGRFDDWVREQRELRSLDQGAAG